MDVSRVVADPARIDNRFLAHDGAE
jgi:hypothetical protein